MALWIRKVKYNYLIAKVARRLIKIQYWLGYHDEALANIQNLAAFCSNNYIGTYRWVELENDIIKISQRQLPTASGKWISQGVNKYILHVITEGYDVGGHTELLVKWIIADNSRHHTIVFTNQKNPIPEKISKLTKTSGTKIIALSPELNLLNKANELRRISFDNEIVILHTHCFDAVPLLAFAYIGGPPIGLLNNADHLFWINAPVSDLILQIRDFYHSFDIERRQIENSEYLPIPISIKETDSYSSIRKELGLSEGQVMLLSIASEYKFEPNANYNYFESIIKVLDACPQAISYIIGVNATSELALKYKNDRIIFLGVFSDTSKYETACDIYVESFPFVSFTSLLQTVARGKACHLIYDPSLLNRCFSNEHFIYPRDKNDWQKGLMRLINDGDFRLRAASEESLFVLSNHSVEGEWKTKLEHCYSKLSTISHSSQMLEKSKWVYTLNEKNMIEIFSNKINLGGIVTSSNYIFRLLIHGLSKALTLYKRLIRV